ncbi:MAG: 3-oxoacyl-[acyl-carrier-protein] reductase [Fastidiosipilaceae bacterium]|jgi:3-oxoacyl-[acyl-carrier protein] reductase|nr:3-oxoacyl-[acyl-carrier-protein] reductase [Clostridiaceae bacterium]
MSIIITGGSRGLGRAIALRLADFNEPIVITYRSGAEQAAATLKELEEKGVPCLAVQADAADETACAEVVRQAETLSPVRVLVNNAGITRDGLAMRMKEADFTQVIDTNLVGPFLMSKAVLPGMAKNRNGSIINITSVAGLYGNAGQANYSASKAGLVGLTKTLAKEMGGRNIRVNAVAPGFIETDMTENLPEKIKKEAQAKISLRRFGQPEDVAGVVKFLASDDAQYITGQVIEVGGGLTL